MTDGNYSISFTTESNEILTTIINQFKSIQSRLSEDRSSRGLNIWKKNLKSDLYSQMENELKTIKVTNDIVDPRSKFMRKISEKIIPGLTPKNILDIVKSEEQNADEDSRVVTRIDDNNNNINNLKKEKKEKKEKKKKNILKSPRMGTLKKDKKKLIDGLKKNLAPTEKAPLKRARSRSLI